MLGSAVHGAFSHSPVAQVVSSRAQLEEEAAAEADATAFKSAMGEALSARQMGGAVRRQSADDWAKGPHAARIKALMVGTPHYRLGHAITIATPSAKNQNFTVTCLCLLPHAGLLMHVRGLLSNRNARDLPSCVLLTCACLCVLGLGMRTEQGGSSAATADGHAGIRERAPGAWCRVRLFKARATIPAIRRIIADQHSASGAKAALRMPAHTGRCWAAEAA